MEASIELKGEVWADLKRDHDQWHARRPTGTARCGLGEPFARGTISPGQPTFYIMGINAGEPKEGVPDGPHTPAAKKWVRQCNAMMDAAGASGFISIERCYWGSPNVYELAKRIGDPTVLRNLLKQHALANRALFQDYPPSIVWVPGVSQFRLEAIEDYDLDLPGTVHIDHRKGRHHTVWLLHKDPHGVPFLFTKHPAARPSRADWDAIRRKVSELTLGSGAHTGPTVIQGAPL